METRLLFWGLQPATVVAFYLVGFSAIGIFIWGVARAVRKYRRGRPLPVSLDWKANAWRTAADILAHRTLRRRDRFAGAAHAALFFGFATLAAGTATITLEYDLLAPLFGVRFWKGAFFLAFSLALDMAGLALVAGLLAMGARRAFFALDKLDYRRGGVPRSDGADKRWRIEDWVFLVALLLIALSGFLQEGLRHAMERPAWAAWEPVGAAVGAALLASGIGEAGIATLRAANWWIHGIAALAFVAALPWYKAKHILAAVGALLARDSKALARLPRPEPGSAGVGVAALPDFSWKDLLDFDACTKCGRCHEACPARAAGYPLSPRDLILDLRLHNDAAQGRSLPGRTLVGGVIDPETLWSCRACGACLEICPVGIEHPVKIVQMRRHLVETDRLDPLLRTMLDTIARSGNSFGESARKRSAWTRELGFAVKDLRKEAADVLWFVGDQAAFDPRNQKVTRTVARLLRAAKVDFGLLHEAERTAGNDVRRVGEEGLFEALAEHNLAQMRAARPFSRLLTTDPHTYNTLRNEYPAFGTLPPVTHYTEMLCELLEAGALKVRRPLGLRVTFHDPCHLGRLNGRYDAPRRVLALIGCELVEMPRNRDNSFCCGAGGGRIWIPDKPGTRKPSELRVREAAALGKLDVFVTCCPKDLTMFEDARKTAGLEQQFVVEDLAELVARAVELEAIEPKDLPGLVERIAAAVADRVAGTVAARLDAWVRALPAALPVPSVPQRMEPAAPDRPPATGEIAREPVPAAPCAWTAAPVRPAQLPAHEVPERNGVRILVAVKHVGKLGEDFRIGEDGRAIPGEYFEYALNEWDDGALEQALRTVEARGGGEVVVVTVGPEPAEETLRKALAKGAHRAVRVWDEALDATDPLAVARLIAGVAQREGPDLVITGAQSGDLANGATGTALARLLGLPRAAMVVAMEWDGGTSLQVTRELEGGLRHRIRLPMPALVTLQTGANVPRYATMRMVKQAREKPLAVVTAGGEANAFRSASVARLYVPPATRASMLQGNADEVAAEVIRIIRERKGVKA